MDGEEEEVTDGEEVELGLGEEEEEEAAEGGEEEEEEEGSLGRKEELMSPIPTKKSSDG